MAVLLCDGTLLMWGHDDWGQIGVGASGFYQAKPMPVMGIRNVAAVIAVERPVALQESGRAR